METGEQGQQEQEARGPGRPRLARDPRIVTLTIPLSRRERQRIQQYAQKRGLQMASFVRHAALSVIAAPVPRLPV